MIRRFEVHIELDGTTVPMADVDVDERGTRTVRAEVRCRRDYLARPVKPTLDPATGLDSARHVSETLPRGLGDAGPDDWGQQLIRRAHGGRALSETEFLLAADDLTRMSALRLRADPTRGYERRRPAQGIHQRRRHADDRQVPLHPRRHRSPRLGVGLPRPRPSGAYPWSGSGWRLSPAFDITPDPVAGTPRVTLIDGEGHPAHEARALIGLADEFAIPVAVRYQILTDVLTACCRWRTQAEQVEIDDAEIARVGRVLDDAQQRLVAVA